MSRRVSPIEIAAAINSVLAGRFIDPAAPTFFLWERPDRAIVSINPSNVKSLHAVHSEEVRHHISTALGGVRVVRTNSIGLYYQVGYEAALPARLEFRPLDLGEQPSPLHVPLGMTAQGPTWLSISEIGSALIGGTRRLGKTRLIHGWIQALIAGAEAHLYLYDGKNGVEFSRYAGEPGVVYTSSLLPVLQSLLDITGERGQLFRSVHATSLAEYNNSQRAPDRLAPLVLIVDEVVTLSLDELELLGKIIAVGGAYGIHPVVATQRTGASEVPSIIKTNMATRISLPVPAVQDSMVILGRPGAEKLPKTAGRLLYVWGGRLITAQAYQVELPGTPEISGDELDLAAWIVETQGGRVSIPRLVQERGMREWDAREMLDVWQSRGWLVGGGQGVARRVSPALEALIPQSLKAPQSASKSQSAPQS